MGIIVTVIAVRIMRAGSPEDLDHQVGRADVLSPLIDERQSAVARCG